MIRPIPTWFVWISLLNISTNHAIHRRRESCDHQKQMWFDFGHGRQWSVVCRDEEKEKEEPSVPTRRSPRPANGRPRCWHVGGSFLPRPYDRRRGTGLVVGPDWWKETSVLRVIFSLTFGPCSRQLSIHLPGGGPTKLPCHFCSTSSHGRYVLRTLSLVSHFFKGRKKITLY